MPHLIQGKRALHLGAPWRGRRFHPMKSLGLQPATKNGDLTWFNHQKWTSKHQQYGDISGYIRQILINHGWLMIQLMISSEIVLSMLSWYIGGDHNSFGKSHWNPYEITEVPGSLGGFPWNLMPIPSTFAKARCRSDPNIASLATSVLLLVVSPCCVPSVQWFFYRTDTEKLAATRFNTKMGWWFGVPPILGSLHPNFFYTLAPARHAPHWASPAVRGAGCGHGYRATNFRDGNLPAGLGDQPYSGDKKGETS